MDEIFFNLAPEEDTNSGDAGIPGILPGTKPACSFK